MGLLYYGKLGNILMCAIKTGSINDTDNFVNKINTPTDSTSFAALNNTALY
jgi:hypothetical protein